MNTTFRIKKIREYRNYTQAYMARQLEISQNAYSKLEKKIAAIKADKLEKIAKILNVPVDLILSDNTPLFYIDHHLEKDHSNKEVINQMEKMFMGLQEEIKCIKDQNNLIINTLESKYDKF